MTASVADINNNTSRETARVETQNTRGVEEEFWHLELLEEHLSCFDSIADRVVRRLCQHHWVLSRVHFQLFEDVSPDLLHILPVLHDAVLHWVRQLQDTLEFFLFTQSNGQYKGNHLQLVGRGSGLVLAQ